MHVTYLNLGNGNTKEDYKTTYDAFVFLQVVGWGGDSHMKARSILVTCVRVYIVDFVLTWGHQDRTPMFSALTGFGLGFYMKR